MADAAKPIVAAVDGCALGSALEIALGCDTIVVTDRARLGLPEATLGLIPGGGGSQLLLTRVDPAMATELMVTRRTLGASEALQLGLADEVTTPGALTAAAVARAQTGRRTPRLHATPGPQAVAAATAVGSAVRRPVSEAARHALLLHASGFALQRLSPSWPACRPP